MIEMTERSLSAVIEIPHFVDAMQRGVARFEHYRAFMPFSPRKYSRTLLEKTADYELVAMLWAPGSVSPIHDHGDSRCWVVLLDGAIDVENYERLDDGELTPRLNLTSHERIARGQIDHRLHRRELHRVRNIENAPAYSLQLYAAPLDTFTIVDDLTGFGRLATPHYDAVVDL